MASISRRAVVPYDAEQMCRLVNDVERYPHFLPFCSDARVLTRVGDEMTASVDLKVGAFRRQFVTRNRLTPGRRIDIGLVSGPFRSLEGDWRFEPRESGCEVILELEYEFSGRLVSLALAPIFGHLGETLVSAFSKRAEEIYG
ncbi:MAG: type II toxin-antitoxin system RatA family toxin [Gammaproteobacteria bacterium]|nr:type II toxin-antitoxin system RatA family toxin [Gammaproteobacteria bacterium]